MANRVETKGTIMVEAIVMALSCLEEDVDLVEFLRIVQRKCFDVNASSEHQTPQVAIFPHEKIIFHKK
jgi:hypothetical protein